MFNAGDMDIKKTADEKQRAVSVAESEEEQNELMGLIRDTTKEDEKKD